MTAVQTMSVGLCSSTSNEMCNVVVRLALAVDATGVITAKVTKVSYTTWEGGAPPPGFTPPQPAQVEAAQTFTLRKEKADLLMVIDSAGNRTPFCDPKGPSAAAGECGA
jgi:hypothetical protein